MQNHQIESELKLNPWILAARPKTILASIGPVLIGLAVAFYHLKTINTLIAVLTLICAILLQIATNIANDYLDFKKGIDGDDRLGPTRVTSKGLIPEKQMRNALITLLLLAFLIGIYLMISGGLVIIIIGLLSLYFSYGYTGGPFPLSYNGLGEVFAFIFFGPVAVCGTTYLQTHQFDKLAFLLGAGVGFISAAILAVNNLRDIHTDAKTKKKTIAVIFGEKFQRYLIITLIILSVIIALMISFTINNYLMPLTLFIALLFSSEWKKILTAPISSELNLRLAKTAQYLFLYSLIVAISLVVLKS